MLAVMLIIRLDRLYLRLIKKNGKGVKYEKINIIGPNILYPKVNIDGIIPAKIDNNISFFDIIYNINKVSFLHMILVLKFLLFL